MKMVKKMLILTKNEMIQSNYFDCIIYLFYYIYKLFCNINLVL